MALNHGVVDYKTRAKQIASELSEQIYKKDIMERFSCATRTASEVYKVKGWKVISKRKEASTGQTEAFKRTKSNKANVNLSDAPMFRPGDINWLTRRWM